MRPDTHPAVRSIRPVRAGHLLAANAVTLFGSAFAFIPLGAYFAREFPTGLGFPLFLAARLLPGLVLAQWYGARAGRVSPQHVITRSQWVAGVASLTVIPLLGLGMPWLPLLVISVGIGYGSSLKSLFPAFLNLAAPDAAQAHGAFSRWYLVRASALLVATSAGGWLASRVPLPVFLMVDSATFLLAYLIWRAVPEQAFNPSAPTRTRVRFSAYAGSANLANFWRNIFLGTFGALIPALVMESHHGDTALLGHVYLLVGAATVGGAWLARRVDPTLRNLLWLSVLELVILACGVMMPDLWGFMLLVAVACGMAALLEVLLQTRFIAFGARQDSAATSAIFQSTENAASLGGYVVALGLAYAGLAASAQLLVASIFAVASVVQLGVGRARGEL